MSYNKNFFVLISLIFLLAIPSSLIAAGEEQFTEEEHHRASVNFNRYVYCSNYRPSQNEDKRNYAKITGELRWKMSDYEKLFYSFIILSKFKVTPETEKRPKHEEAFTGIFKDYLIALHAPENSARYIDANHATFFKLTILNAGYLSGKEGILPLSKEKLLNVLDEK